MREEMARHPMAYKLKHRTTGTYDGKDAEFLSFEAGGPSTAELTIVLVDGEVVDADEICWGTWYDVILMDAEEVIRIWRADGRDR